MKKICVVLTSRGNYAKFKRFLDISRDCRDIRVQVLTGGELTLREHAHPFPLLKPDLSITFNLPGDTLFAMGKSAAAAMAEFCNGYRELGPDLVMLVGDRFETFAAASAAYLSGIPIAHLEGGEQSGGLDDGLRYAVSELSSIHFPCTESAGEILTDRGFNQVHVVGCTSLDELGHYQNKPQFTRTLQERSGSGPVLDPDEPFLLVIWHPDTSNLKDVPRSTCQLISAINKVKMPTFWMNANLDAGSDTIGSLLRKYRDQARPDFIHFFKSLPIENFQFLLEKAACIVGNSSCGIREASFTGTPNLCVGERQYLREHGPNTITTTAETGNIVAGIEAQIRQGPYRMCYLYGDGTASEKILEIVRK